MNKKIILSIIIPIVFFGIFIGSTNFLKEEKTNPQNLPVVTSKPQYIMYSFEDNIKNKGVAVLATVNSIETKLVDYSRNETRYVYNDGADELREKLLYKFINEEITNDELLEIMEQERTGETYIVYIENKIPIRYITLHVDQYLADITGQFTDTIVVHTGGYGEGIRNGENVYYPNNHNIEYLIGEQAIYVLTDLADPDFLSLDGYCCKYTIADDMIQSKLNQHLLEDNLTDTQVAQVMDGTLTLSNNQLTDTSIIWNLPISLEEAITRGLQVGTILNQIGNN